MARALFIRRVHMHKQRQIGLGSEVAAQAVTSTARNERRARLLCSGKAAQGSNIKSKCHRRVRENVDGTWV